MYYGLDIDGTRIVLDMFDSDRQLQWEKQMPTPHDSYDVFLDAVCELVAEADRCFGCKGSVGIGTPGMPEIEDGTLYATNIPAVSDKLLCIDLNARLGRDIRPDNNVNCLAPSEAQDDEFIQYPPVMGLILGTGVGDGLIFNGKPITGKGYITGEFGHMYLPVDVSTVMGLDLPLRYCGCGQHDCIENCLSGRGSAWLYQHYYHQPLQTPEVIALYDQGDEQVRAHVERYLGLLAVCLGNILTIVDSDLVVTGGNLSSFPAITVQLADKLSRHLLPVARVSRIECARHGDVEGVRSVAFLHLTD